MKGRRLPILCRPRQSRGGQLALAVVVFSTWAALALAAVWSRTWSGELDHPFRRRLIVGLFGGVLLFMIPALARAFRHYGAAGLSSVEVELRPGRELSYSVLQERGMSKLEVMDVRLLCCRVKLRQEPVELWSRELGRVKPHDSIGSRARLEGSLRLPEDAPASSPELQWSIEVRARFADGTALAEPFEVPL